MATVRIKATTNNGLTLGKLGQVIEQRMKYMNESARSSVSATAIQVLRSIRTKTRVAKKSGIKVEVKQDSGLYPSFYTVGKKKFACVRDRGSNNRHQGEERLIYHSKLPAKSLNVYRFKDENGQTQREYLIVCPTIGEAKKVAKSIVVRRAMRYSGLAKRAISMLMYRTNTKKVNDGLTNPHVETKASDLTDKHESITNNPNGTGGKYTLILNDALRYALKAIRGGKAAVDTLMKKAMNKVVSIINQKLKKNNDFFSPSKLDTPFPEVRLRK